MDVHKVKKKDFRGKKMGKPVKGPTKKNQATSCNRCGQKHEKAPKSPQHMDRYVSNVKVRTKLPASAVQRKCT